MKYRKEMDFLILVFVMLICLLIQSSTLAWEKTFGGSEHDTANSVQQTSDGGYIIVGSTKSFAKGLSDVYLIKTDAAGNEQWSKTFDGLGNDPAHSVQQTSDGGYVIAGRTGNIMNYDVYLIKTDASGNEQWSKTYGGESYDWAWSVQQTQDGGYIVLGSTMSFGSGYYDFYLIKTDGSGNEQWSKTFGGHSKDWAYSVQQTDDGGYILTGSSRTKGRKILIVKTDPSGNQQWVRLFGNDYQEMIGNSIRQTRDGGYIIAGWKGSWVTSEHRGDIFLLKTDKTGNKLWYRTFSGAANETTMAVQQTRDGGYIIVGGYSRFFGITAGDVYLIKTDSAGKEEWHKTFGGRKKDRGCSVQQTSDGGYIIAGYTESFGTGKSDIYLIKTDASGNK